METSEQDLPQPRSVSPTTLTRGIYELRANLILLHLSLFTAYKTSTSQGKTFRKATELRKNCGLGAKSWPAEQNQGETCYLLIRKKHNQRPRAELGQREQ